MCSYHAATVVIVRAQGTARTGETYQLICTVTKDSSISDTPLITWVVSGQQITSNGSGITLGPLVTNGTTSSSMLQFDPLTVMHEGDYTCQAVVGATNVSYRYSVTVESKWIKTGPIVILTIIIIQGDLWMCQ